MMESDIELRTGKFPDGFMWSAATASYQVEGAWNEDDKSLGVWDEFTHTPGKVYNNDNGDVACDSYHKIKEDLEALKKLGVSHYRFSLSWPRILPRGSKELVNPKGIAYYNKLIDALLENKIEPVATIYHWDHPQCVEELGGWLSRDIIRYFVEYADVCFASFGDRVKWWATINEPVVFSTQAYGVGWIAPGVKSEIGFSFEVSHHLILAHVETFHLYNNKYRSEQKGKIGICAYSEWAEPITRCTDDVEASERMLETRIGLFYEPICGNGDYPGLIKSRFKTLQELGKIPAHISLPEFTEEEKQKNKGTLDFIGLNYYTGKLAKNIDDMGPRSPMNFEFLDILAKVQLSIDPSWKRGGSSWLYHVPWGLRKMLQYLKKRYGDMPIFILENGISDADGNLNDEDRIKYVQQHLNAVLEAITLDNVNVIGYTLWSLMDNLEWSKGYSEKFGLFRVDQNDSERKRIGKKSVEFYANVIKNNGYLTSL